MAARRRFCAHLFSTNKLCLRSLPRGHSPQIDKALVQAFKSLDEEVREACPDGTTVTLLLFKLATDGAKLARDSPILPPRNARWAKEAAA